MQEFKITEQMVEVVNQWLEFKGYEDLHDYGHKEVAPNDGSTGQDVLSEDSGVEYGEEYLIENIVLCHLSKFTITKEKFLNFYYNSGDDGSQHQMRIDVGYEVVNALLDGEEYKLPDAQELFENCGYIRMSDCEEVIHGHPLEDYENCDIDWSIDIEGLK